MALGEVVQAIGAVAAFGGFAIEVVAMIGLGCFNVGRSRQYQIQGIGGVIWLVGIVLLIVSSQFFE